MLLYTARKAPSTNIRSASFKRREIPSRYKTTWPVSLSGFTPQSPNVCGDGSDGVGAEGVGCKAMGTVRELGTDGVNAEGTDGVGAEGVGAVAVGMPVGDHVTGDAIVGPALAPILPWKPHSIAAIVMEPASTTNTATITPTFHQVIAPKTAPILFFLSLSVLDPKAVEL